MWPGTENGCGGLALSANGRVGMSFYNIITANNNSTIVKPYQASKEKFSLIYTSSHAHIYLLLPAFEDESEGSVADEVPR